MTANLVTKKIYDLYHRFGAGVFSVLIFAIFVAACSVYLDPDFGWHLKAGDYIRAHGIPSHDIFTYTARNFPWIDHEWLNDVFVSWLYGLMGYQGLAVFFGLVWGSAVILAGRRLNWALLFVAATAVLPYSGIRPIAWTVLLLAVLERLIEARDRIVLAAVPLLFLLWANLHGGFLVGLAVLGLEAVLQRRASLVAALFGGVLVSFINPYGPRLYTELFRTLGDGSLHFRIQEWLPLTYSLPTLLFLCYAVALFWFMERQRLRAVASVPVALFAAALYSNRNAPLFVVSAVRKFETYVAQLGRKVPGELHRGQRVVLAGLILGPLILAGYGVVSFFTPSGGISYPKQEVAYLQQHPCPGNLFNDYNFGGYLIWQLPGKPVYIDGRMPSWRYRGTDYYANASRIYTDAAFREKQFKQYSIRCVLISRQRAAQQHTLASLIGVNSPKQVSLEVTLERNGWRAIARDQSSVLLER